METALKATFLGPSQSTLTLRANRFDDRGEPSASLRIYKDSLELIARDKRVQEFSEPPEGRCQKSLFFGKYLSDNLQACRDFIDAQAVRNISRIEHLTFKVSFWSGAATLVAAEPNNMLRAENRRVAIIEAAWVGAIIGLSLFFLQEVVWSYCYTRTRCAVESLDAVFRAQVRMANDQPANEDVRALFVMRANNQLGFAARLALLELEQLIGEEKPDDVIDVYALRIHAERQRQVRDFTSRICTKMT